MSNKIARKMQIKKQKTSFFSKIMLMTISIIISLTLCEIILCLKNYSYKPIMFKAIKQKLGAFTKDVCKYDHDMI